MTILFADIVGSTAMGQEHDPEVVRAAMGNVFAAASEILRAHGGTVEKFIGDAVMAVFGVPAAHDDDPDRAVRAAFAIRARRLPPRSISRASSGSRSAPPTRSTAAAGPRARPRAASSIRSSRTSRRPRR